MDKVWRNYAEQVDLLRDRGLMVKDRASAEEFLSQVNYYRLEGYFRYWQIDPENKDNRFISGSSFDTIKRLYQDEQALLFVCDEVLRPIEALLRTRFAYYYAEKVSEVGDYVKGKGFVQQRPKRVEEYVRASLDLSKERFVAHYRVGEEKSYEYPDMPIWVAVEVLSFGCLSRMIEASYESGVLASLADSMNVGVKDLPGQVRSFVYLRNRIAHCAKIWNHSVIDKAGLVPKISGRAKRRYRSFSDESIYKTFVALDYVASQSGLNDSWLSDRVEPILKANRLLAAGIATPAKYGQMPTDLLTRCAI
ncbi:Abi family protein [Buchananella hordeovulneris]|uniref:Abi family protein n=1 Tax=Buchananella hordeovulneris TaxID=52770 RepID=UPI000F5FBED8|nr:Abi family protein [Buchananella hordeovulneris]RRD53514.1 Abi family protein [Buchananella hordeovulneris]